MLIRGHRPEWIERSPTIVKILLIDDHAMVRDALARMLRWLGHTVLPAPSGQAGLARLETSDGVDLVLTDFQMPGMNGVEVAKAVRTRWPHVHVGIITGAPELLAEHRDPVDLVIFKPASLEAIQEGFSQIVHSVNHIGRTGAPQPS